MAIGDQETEWKIQYWDGSAWIDWITGYITTSGSGWTSWEEGSCVESDKIQLVCTDKGIFGGAIREIEVKW